MKSFDRIPLNSHNETYNKLDCLFVEGNCCLKGEYRYEDLYDFEDDLILSFKMDGTI